MTGVALDADRVSDPPPLLRPSDLLPSESSKHMSNRLPPEGDLDMDDDLGDLLLDWPHTGWFDPPGRLASTALHDLCNSLRDRPCAGWLD